MQVIHGSLNRTALLQRPADVHVRRHRTRWPRRPPDIVNYTSATLPTNFTATTEEHSDHCFSRPLSLRPEAHNHSNKRHLSIHDTEEDRLEHETTLDAGDFSDAYPQKKKHKHNLII